MLTTTPSVARRVRRAVLALIAAAAAACAAAPGGGHAAGGDPAAAPAAAAEPGAPLPPSGPGRAAALYLRHCAGCHGADGAGDGPAAAFLFPVPRDFGEGRFRLVRTENGAPTDSDLVDCIERGMPGAAMPSFGWLPADDVVDLARHVRGLAVARMTAELERRYAAVQRPLSAGEARDVATWRLTPGPAVQVPAELEPTEAVLARGRVLFLERCAACHGADGHGQQPDRAWADLEGMHWARDLRRGPLKGGATQTDLARRVLAGMPGVAMPPARFADEAEAGALLAYLRSILPEDADRRGVQRRRQLVAARVAEVAAEPAAPAWDEALPVEVALMPLAQRPDSVEVAELRAMHDGTRIAIRLRWPDPSRDDRAIGGAARRPDQCALQFSADQLPPLFGMGAHDAAVDIWHWSAFRDRELLGALDLLQGGRTDLVQDGAPGLLGPAGHADEIAAQGIGGPRALQERAITVEPQHVDGHWQVVFVRPLAPAAGAPAASVRLTPGAIVQVSCAVWNGAADDVGPRKSISVWQELRLW